MVNNKEIPNQNIYFDKSWGLFVGIIKDNTPHKHFAIQLSISSGKDIVIKKGQSKIYHLKNVLIKSNILHKIECNSQQLLLLIDPASSLGHYLNQLTTEKITSFDLPITTILKTALENIITEKGSFKNNVMQIKKHLDKVNCQCTSQNHFNDDRIQTAINYLELNYNRVIPVEEIANICFLSSSRFLHLFKEKTGITYRRVQLWNKISRSFKSLPHQTITETAHQFGFSDSAHYSKIFKQNFGFSPKLFLRK